MSDIITTLPVTDGYGRTVTQADHGNGTATFTVPDGPSTISTATFPLATPSLGYAQLLGLAPSDYPGVYLSQDPPMYFALAGLTDATLADATKVAIMLGLYGLGLLADAANAALISGMWALMTRYFSISSGDQATVHNYALKYGISGI